MLQLDAAETLRALPFAELVPELARAARELAAGTLRAPERLVVPIEPEGTLLCMPAVAPDIGITKVVTVHASNRARGLPAIQGEVCVFEAASGRRLALLDGPVVTARRTAAVSLSRPCSSAPGRRPKLTCEPSWIISACAASGWRQPPCLLHERSPIDSRRSTG
jgi:hypothetical protein